MTAGQNEHWKQIYRIEETLTKMSNEYWQQYSNMGTWQFWVNLGILILPLVILYILLDRKKAFRLGFFGFNVHVWFAYIDSIGISLGLWGYPYQIIPLMPVHFGLDASLVPVTYMLAYQWIINHDKNPYLYLTGLSILFAFVFKPLLSVFGLFDLNGVNYFHLFLAYIIITLVSLWITNLFLYLQKEHGSPPKSDFRLRKIISDREKAK